MISIRAVNLDDINLVLKGIVIIPDKLLAKLTIINLSSYASKRE